MTSFSNTQCKISINPTGNGFVLLSRPGFSILDVCLFLWFMCAFVPYLTESCSEEAAYTAVRTLIDLGVSDSLCVCVCVRACVRACVRVFVSLNLTVCGEFTLIQQTVTQDWKFRRSPTPKKFSFNINLFPRELESDLRNGQLLAAFIKSWAHCERESNLISKETEPDLSHSYPIMFKAEKSIFKENCLGKTQGNYKGSSKRSVQATLNHAEVIFLCFLLDLKYFNCCLEPC